MNMGSKKKLPYDEGTWFAVPLRTSGYAIGLLARSTGYGTAFGYFFGPRRESVSTMEDIIELTHEKAILIGLFGDLGLLEGDWPIIGRLEGWSRADWPVPPLIRVDRMSGKALKVLYSDDLRILSEEPCDPMLTDKYPSETQSGAGSVEIKLTRLLDS